MALEHLSQAPQFLGPFRSQSSIACPSYNPYYPEVQTVCSGATAAPGACTAISNAPHLAM